jgi:predicted aspartyl protease
MWLLLRHDPHTLAVVRPTDDPDRTEMSHLRAALLSSLLAFWFVSAGCRSLPTSLLELSPSFATTLSVDGALTRCILDTGSAGTLVDGEWAQRSGLVPLASILTARDATGLARALPMVTLRGLRVGTISFEPAPVAAAPIASRIGADALVGMDVLLGLAWIFEPQAGRAIAVDRNRLPSELAARQLEVAATVPIRLWHNQPFVVARANGQEIELLLDTGASETSLTPAAVAALGLMEVAGVGEAEREAKAAAIRQQLEQAGHQNVRVEVRANDQSVGVHGRSSAVKNYRLELLQLGGASWRDLAVHAHVDPKSTTRNLLGRDVLGTMRWAVDWREPALLLLR